MSVESLSPDPHQHTQENNTDAEVFTTPKADAEMIVGDFIEELHRGKMGALHGEDLAGYVTEQLSVRNNDPSQHTALTEIVFASDALGDAQIRDQKLRQDAVFRLLFEKLRETVRDRNVGKAQRTALVKLLDMRAAVISPQTVHDPMWQSLIERLLI